MKSIQEKAREWRSSQELTLEQAGVMLEMSPSYLCEIETGKKGFTTSVIKKYLAADPKHFKPSDFYA